MVGALASLSGPPSLLGGRHWRARLELLPLDFVELPTVFDLLQPLGEEIARKICQSLKAFDSCALPGVLD
jgi:hypothetical protein